MNDWQEVELGDLISIKGGFSYKGEFIGHGTTYLLGMGCVSFNDTFLTNGARLYSGDTPNSFLVNPGDVVLATRQQSDNLPILGAPAIIPKSLDGKRVIVGTNLYKIENESSVHNKFLFWLLRSIDYRKHIDSCSKGSTVKMITKDAVETYKFLCPSEREINEISDILWTLTDKIDLLNRQNATLEKMVETLFRKWFVEEVQEDWKSVKVGDFVKTNVVSITKNYPFDFIQYLDTGSLNEGNIESTQFLKLLEAPSRAKRLVKHNDVLISTVRPNQKHYGIVKNPIENLVVSTGFCVITCEKIDPHFMYILLTTQEMTEYLHSIAEGSTSTYPSLKPSDIEAIEFQLPPNDLLTEFANHCRFTWDKISKNQLQIRTLVRMRDTLLPKLISGEVQVT